jgi:flotillin
MILVLVAAGVFVITFAAILSRYKRCPSDRILVVYGKTGKTKAGGASSAKCIHGGAAFIWPVFQNYAFLDLRPISIECNLTNALSKQNIRVDIPSRFTVGISTEPENMTNAAERLLGLSRDSIQELARDILFGQLRLVIATMDIEEINADRDKFLLNVSQNVEQEMRKIGLKLINVNVTDIRDESGYIEALGKEAAAKAINEAKKSVAEQERFGEIGKAEADRDREMRIAETLRDRDIRVAETQRDRDIQIANAMKEKEIQIAGAQRDEMIGKAEATRDTRVRVSEANAVAVEGENKAKISIANTDSERREREAEANKRAISSEKIQSAKALEESYQAERDAENARKQREEATQKANIIVKAEIEKQKVVIEAEAEAEKLRTQAKGEADAIFAKMQAEAKGLNEILTKQADGFGKIVGAAGGDSKEAVLLMISDKLPELVKTQVEAIKNIKIDKITVWDGQNGKNGKTATANFMSGLMQSVPPLNELFNMAGMQLPSYLGTEQKEQEVTENATVE